MEGSWQQGLEIELEAGIPKSWHATSKPPEPVWLSPPFVNAHSHLEYRGHQGKLVGLPYWDWLRELTRLKSEESNDEVRQWCRVAAQENKAAGVGLIVEHSDRPYAVNALRDAGIGGRVLQELITFDEAPDTKAKWAQVEARRIDQGADALTPHATWSVDRDSLRQFEDQPFVSIHAAESSFEADLFEDHGGPIAEFFIRRGKPLPRRQPLLDMLDEVGLLRPGVQLVHAGAIPVGEYDRLAESGVVIAHCPRSNINLGCPLPDIRALLDRGIPVGLGLDSAASSGPISMLDEMRSMSEASAITAEEAWSIATDASHLGLTTEGLPWQIIDTIL